MNTPADEGGHTIPALEYRTPNSRSRIRRIAGPFRTETPSTLVGPASMRFFNFISFLRGSLVGVPGRGLSFSPAIDLHVIFMYPLLNRTTGSYCDGHDLRTG